MNTSTQQQKISAPVRFLGGILIIIAISLAVFYYLMKPPMVEINLMVFYLSITAVISALVGYGAYRLGWMHKSPTIRWTLLGGYALASLLTFINVWVTAKLMFTSEHDLLLALVLLVFAGGIAMALGYLLSSALTDRIQQLSRAAQSLAKGNLRVRVPVNGRDEMAGLAANFNQMAAQLQTAAEKQKQVEDMRRDLIAWVSHDLHTPLASIRAIVEALADGIVDDPDTVQRYLLTVQKDIRSLSALIDDLFQMAQLDAGGPPLDCGYNSIRDLISDTLESFSEIAARRSVALLGDVESGVDLIYMDAQRVGRVLSNLLGNALRHTPAGGTVEVKAVTANGSVLVEVQDSGEGIRSEDLPQIFERFYRGEKSRSRATGGSGLGLAIAKGIIEAHGGEIGVTPLDNGTRFYFILPQQQLDER